MSENSGSSVIKCDCPDGAYDLHVEGGCSWLNEGFAGWTFRDDGDNSAVLDATGRHVGYCYDCGVRASYEAAEAKRIVVAVNTEVTDERCGRHYYCTIAPHADRIPCQSGDMIRRVLAELVRLKDGPRDDAYRAQKEAAWTRARVLLREAEEADGTIPCPDCDGRGAYEGDLIGEDGEVVECNAPSVQCQNCGGFGSVDAA